MWGLFKKKEPETPKAPPVWLNQWNQVQQDFPVGSTFEYLGRTMMVFRHRPYIKGHFTKYSQLLTQYPVLECEYADDNGVLHTWLWYMESFNSLPKKV